MTHYDYYDIMDMLLLPNRRLTVLEDDDEVYDNYIETTVDPGQTLFIIATFICIASLICIPLSVMLGTCLTNCKHEGGTEADSEEDLPLVEYTGGGGPHQSQTDSSELSFIQRCRKTNYLALLFVLYNVIRWRKWGTHTRANMEGRREAVVRGMAREARESMLVHQRHAQEARVDVDLAGSIVEYNNGQRQTPLMTPENEKRNNQVELHDPEDEIPPTHTPTPLCSVRSLRQAVQFMWSIAKHDDETKRILRLAIPFTFSAITGTMSDLITLAIISRQLGTDAMVAYAMVGVIVGISSSFMGGWVEAISSLGSMAYGAENYELLGQYVQTSCIGYVLCEIPFAFIWGMTIGNIILLMGFEEPIAVLAQDFVFVRVAINMMTGLNEAVLDFLEVVEKEKYATVMYCLSSLCQLGLVALFAIKMDASLVDLGLVMLTNQSIFFFLNVLIPNNVGWLTHFEPELFGQCSFRNRSMLKDLFKTALPLAFGSLLAYTEWEILTIFAAILGPAEAATWAILGFVWGVFESTTEAIGGASEVRCAYQLGKGEHAFKSMFLALILAVTVTVIFMSLSPILPALMTHDPVIQAMLAELFPLMALGNVTMNMGMVCWALIGAQGRYRLATSIALGCSMLITIPIGAIVTLRLRIDLQGLTFSVVIGYTITAMLLSTCLMMSDWESLSKEIQEKMAAEEDSDSDDDSSSSSSSSIGSSRHQASQSRSIVDDFFEIPPATPGTVVPPPPHPNTPSHSINNTRK
eukprot:CAMPEP_0201871326 /NCGR_PEP_ID=MMETSP0902-20130614/4272_1 /ASSEMBLY_ACC=CAM_ASM_000551 /TAXON_ID=420261 /ORGANISM="Thalassiosira antarctica, Strain CCMP982" /LENGTH=750 /DNA_ID=CAMNT_0048397275 /DNA_START=148 /DNA_END=2400 /DNA_ORIENTATION=+